MLRTMQAVILAAGRGSRLSPLTDTAPKPLIPVAGKPILKQLIESLPDEIDEIIIVTGYKGETIQDYFGTHCNGKTIRYVKQGEMCGTYGALLSAKDLISTEPFLVMGADDIQDKEALRRIIKHPLAFGVHHKPLPSKDYLIVDIHHMHVRGMRKPTDVEYEESQPMATGIYVLDNRVWNYEPVEVKGGEYGLPHTLRPMLLEYDFTAVEMPEWIQINSHEELAYAETELLKKRSLQ